jgi:predicted ester cyclase
MAEDDAAREEHLAEVLEVGHLSLKTFMAVLRGAFPDFRCQRTANLIADGNEVVVRWVCEGTHTGPAYYYLIMGALPKASSRKMRFTGMSVVRLEDGAIAGDIGLADGVTALAQLGFIRGLPRPATSDPSSCCHNPPYRPDSVRWRDRMD